MKSSELEGYSLVLIKGKKIIFKSKDSGLKPLIECVKKFKNKINKCVLYDKVVGLAAARLIVYSGMVSEVITPLCSEKAKDFLIKNKIKINAEKIVENILKKDKTDICPMELKALETENNEEFLDLIKKTFNNRNV